MKNKIILPVYWTNVKKTKANTTHLVGMNFMRNCHYHIKNKIKQDMSLIIKDQLAQSSLKPIIGKYSVNYYYYYKSKVSDNLNVGAYASKIFLDVLQTEGYVKNDNVQYCIEEHFYVASQDKENPRIEIEIKGIK